MSTLIAPAPGWLRRAIGQGVARLPSLCPLCGLAARGGDLCAGCATDVRASAQAVAARCPRCWLALPRRAMVCPDCQAQPPTFAQVIAAFDYRPPLDGLIRALKTEQHLAQARTLARLLAQALRRAHDARDLPMPLTELAALLPIPASRASLRQRGFNPAREIARTLGTELGIAVRPGWLSRTREAGKQSALGRRARQRGADGLYRCPQKLPPVWVAVVDDVMTTGSTLNAAARALRVAGAAGVLALVAARTPHAGEDGDYSATTAGALGTTHAP